MEKINFSVEGYNIAFLTDKWEIMFWKNLEFENGLWYFNFLVGLTVLWFSNM